MPRRWQAVILLAVVAGLNYADRTALSVVFPLLQKDLGLSDLQLAGVGTLFLWSYALGSPFAGRLADRMRRDHVVTWSLFGWSLVTVLSGFARTANELLATRVLLGLAECFYLPAAIALIADHHPTHTRARAMAVHMCGLYAGMVGGGWLSGYLGELYGWRAGLWCLGAAGLVMALVCAWKLREAGQGEKTQVASVPLLEVLKERRFLLIAMQSMLIAVGTWMFFNWMPLYFRESFGLSLAVAGLSGTAVVQLSSVVGTFTGGILSDRAAQRSADGRLRLMTFCYLLCAPCLLVFLTGGGVWVVAAGVIVFSVIKAIGAANEAASLCEVVTDRGRATAQSLMNTLNTLAGGAGVLVAGYLKADWGLDGVFAGVGVLVIIAAGMAWMARPK
jgi:MFS transporter, Spinster family, sphingosine-1-phosphate transporter